MAQMFCVVATIASAGYYLKSSFGILCNERHYINTDINYPAIVNAYQCFKISDVSC